ncbi:sensor histidine kinase [Jatrophihabitans telluris]|uniref:sensor histidine kinase n=1 Tax=Jatrophihabitans telluris TaxID=2038343 RepID=UPI0024C06708|nr:ATP-binding protein [Jatrophihabitans telluris]
MTVVVVVAAFLAGAAVSAVVLLRWPPSPAGRPADDAGVTDLPLPEPVRAPMAERELARKVLGAIDVGIVVVDRDEVAIFANAAALRMGVVDHDRLTVTVLSELVREVTDTCVPDAVALELPAVKGGDVASYLVTVLPLADDLAHGRVSTVLLRFTDITETRRLERVRRDFVANVSHELKTPVGALTLLAEAVQDAADDPEAVQRFARRMQHEGARLGRLVQELIELSRLQGAEPLPGQEIVDVASVISEAVDRARLAAESAGITVVERAEGSLKVHGNETQLVTAVANLVDNAVAYSPERTKVGVSARAMRDADGTEWAEIAVTDQGIGIAEVDLDRVFERFFRVDPARSRATGGTGLGLAIVKHIASNHGGSVAVWSVSGSGSTFTIRLPLAGSPAAHPRVGS